MRKICSLKKLKYWFRFLGFYLCFLPVPVLSGEADSKIEILYPGFYYAGTISNQTGEKWFGLYEKKNGFELIETEIIVDPTEDACSGDKPGETTGWNVRTKRKEQPLIFVRGFDELKNGLVKTIFCGRLFIAPDQDVQFGALDSVQNQLVAGGSMIPKSTNQELHYEQYTLTLYGENKKQLLSIPSKSYPGECELDVIWVGDLDRDGKLDFLLDLPKREYTRNYTLFLSSKAKNPNIVEKVAELLTGSC